MELLSCWSFSCDFFKGLKLPALIYGGPQVPFLSEQIQAQLDAALFTTPKFPKLGWKRGDSSGRHKWFAECQFTLWPGAKEGALMLISSSEKEVIKCPGFSNELSFRFMMLKQAQEEIHPHYRRRKAGGEEKRQRGERVTEREAECLDSYSYVILHLFWLDFNF